MLNTIENIYNKLPANLWEYKLLIDNYQFPILVIFFLIAFFMALKNSRDNVKLKKALLAIPNLEVNQQLINLVNNNKSKIFDSEINNKATEEKIKKINEELENIYINKTVEYNPYKDMGVGGKQSFSTAFINKKGDGIILTSLYARDRTRFLLKEIKNFNSEKELAPEEKEVLKLFRN